MPLSVYTPYMDTRWTIKVSQETDRTLRTFLAQRGMKKGDLSHFVEEAVQERLLRLAIAEAREENADLSAEEIAALVDEELQAVRRARRP